MDAYRFGACIRRPNEDRIEAEQQAYHKGWEVRFYANSDVQASDIVRVLTAAGLEAGNPYHKHPRRWIVPLYGHRAVDQVRTWVEDAANADGPDPVDRPIDRRPTPPPG